MKLQTRGRSLRGSRLSKSKNDIFGFVPERGPTGEASGDLELQTRQAHFFGFVPGRGPGGEASGNLDFQNRKTYFC